MLEKSKLYLILLIVVFLGFSFTPVVQAITISSLKITPSSYDFSNVSIGGDKDKSFNIRNIHLSQTLTIDKFDLSGRDHDQFEVLDEEDCVGKLLDPGEECNFEVRFSPDDDGNFDADLEITIDEDAGNSKKISLEGTGEESENDIDFSDDTLSFDDTYVGYDTLEEVEIENKGSKIFTIEDINLDGTDESDYEVDDRDCINHTLAKNESCMLIVLFSPRTIGLKTAQVEVALKYDNQDYKIELSGEAVNKDNGITVSPVSKDLGDFEKQEKASIRISIESDVATAYKILNVTLKGSNGFKINKDECEGEEIDNGTNGGDILDDCDITVNFTANEGGLLYSVLEIDTEDPNNSKFSIPLYVFVEGAYKYPNDIAGNTLEVYIKRLLDKKVLNGFSDGSFKPDDNVTRGQLAKFIFNAFGIVEDTNCVKFPDINLTYTFYKEIMSLKCSGVVTGYSDGDYKPEESVTRGEVTKFISKALEKKGLDVDLTIESEFPDVDDSDKFIIYIAYLASIRFDGQNIISGFSDGEFKSQRNTTRGEMSKMIDIAMRYYQDN